MSRKFKRISVRLRIKLEAIKKDSKIRCPEDTLRIMDCLLGLGYDVSLTDAMEIWKLYSRSRWINITDWNDMQLKGVLSEFMEEIFDYLGESQ